MDERELLSVGTVIEDDSYSYRIEGTAGYGGSAIIYRARQYRSGEMAEKGKKVLLKEIYPAKENAVCFRKADGSVVSDYEEKLLDEMREKLGAEEEIGEKLKDRSFLVCNLERLKKPHLHGETTSLYGLAKMPDMKESAELLSDWLRRREASDSRGNERNVQSVLELFAGIAESLQKIHQAGYLYCDFSPENVFVLTDTNIVVFIDFGCVLSCQYQKKTETESYIPATWGYRAPELCQTGLSGNMHRTLSAAVDIYSITAFFYRTICGENFAERKAEFMRSVHPEKRVVSWEKMCLLGVSDPVSALFVNELFLYGLAFEAGNRIQDLDSFRTKLQNIKESLQKRSLYEALSFLWDLGYGWLGEPAGEKNSRFKRLVEHFFETAVPQRGSLQLAVEEMERSLKKEVSVHKQLFILRWLNLWFQKGQKLSPETEFRLHYCGVGIYNNIGACVDTIYHYESCMELASPLDLISYMGLRLRGAENYANFFDYQKAWKIVRKNCELLKERKNCYRWMAEQLSLPAGSAERTVEFGKNLSAAGRYLAFLGAEKQAAGKDASAKTYFRKSRACFEAALEEFQGDSGNCRRVYNTLLQLAAAARDEALFEHYRRLMDDSTEKIEKQIQNRLQNLHGQNLYDVPVMLKGIRVFQKGRLDDNFAAELLGLAELGEKTEYPTDQHPWELIFKEAAILLTKYHGCVGEAEEKLFALAAGGEAGMVRIEECRKMNGNMTFSTLTVLYFAALIQKMEYKVYYSNIENEKESLSQEEEDLLDTLFQYVRKNKCGFLTAKEWKACRGVREKYELMRKKLIYEYD